MFSIRIESVAKKIQEDSGGVIIRSVEGVFYIVDTIEDFLNEGSEPIDKRNDTQESNNLRVIRGKII